MTLKKLRILACLNLIIYLGVIASWHPATYTLKVVDAVICIADLCFSVWLIMQKRKLKKQDK